MLKNKSPCLSQALADNGLMPRVISGSSAGSIIAAIVGTRTEAELQTMFDDPGSFNLEFFPEVASDWSSLKRNVGWLFNNGVLMDIQKLGKALQANVPDMTFQEAFDHSGRIVNIVVSPASGNRDTTARLLNYLTAPNVLVWSASLVCIRAFMKPK